MTTTIAEDHWSYRTTAGIEVMSRVRVGRPRVSKGDSRGDWCCPLSIEHVTDGVLEIAGVGPVDALMNAMAVVKAFADQIGAFMPRATSPHRQRVTARRSRPSRRTLVTGKKRR